MIEIAEHKKYMLELTDRSEGNESREKRGEREHRRDREDDTTSERGEPSEVRRVGLGGGTPQRRPKRAQAATRNGQGGRETPGED